MRHHQTRLRHPARSTALLAVTVALASGAAVTLPTATATAATAATAAEVVIPAPDEYGDRAETLLSTGDNGVLHQEQGSNSYLWTNTYNSRTKSVTALDGVPRESIFTMHDTANRVAYAGTDAEGRTTITLLGMEDTSRTTVPLPTGYLHPEVHGGFILVSHAVDGGDAENPAYELRVVRGRGTSVTSDIPVRLPADATAEAEPVLLGGEGTSLLIRYRTGDTHGYGLLNGITGAVSPLPVTGTASSFRLTRDTVTWFTRDDNQGVRQVNVLPRDGSSTTPAVVPLESDSPDTEITTYVVGANVLWYEGERGPLRLVPLSGAESPRVLLARTEQALQGSGGTLVALGRDADGGRAIHHFSIDGNGLVSDLPLREVTPVKVAEGELLAVGLDRGTVRYVNNLRGVVRLHGKDIGTGLDPAAGDDLPVHGLAPTPAGRFADGGDKGLARLVTETDDGNDVLVTGDEQGPSDGIPLPGRDGRIADISPEYVLYEAGDGNGEGDGDGDGDGDGRQYVVDVVRGRIVDERPAGTAAALDFSTLWTPSPDDPGKVVATDLRTGDTAAPVSLGADCTPEELQSNGTLLYWSCPDQDTAGVLDPVTGTDYPAPTDDVLLGDGFLASYTPNTSGSTIRLTRLDADGTTADLGTVTGVKYTSAADSRGVTWAVDRRAGKLAYIDTSTTVHVVAPQQSISALSVPDSAVPAGLVRGETWHPRWWLSKPAASWELTLRHGDTEVRTWTGDETRSRAGVSWDGTTSDGAQAPNGTYTWTLTATPADGTGDPVTVSGELTVSGS